MWSNCAGHTQSKIKSISRRAPWIERCTVSVRENCWCVGNPPKSVYIPSGRIELLGIFNFPWFLRDTDLRSFLDREKPDHSGEMGDSIITRTEPRKMNKRIRLGNYWPVASFAGNFRTPRANFFFCERVTCGTFHYSRLPGNYSCPRVTGTTRRGVTRFCFASRQNGGAKFVRF